MSAPTTKGNASTTNPTGTTKNKKGSKPKKYPFWKNLIAMILLLAAVVGIAYFCSIIYTRHGEEVTVPNLRGLTVQQAFDRLEELGLEADIRDSVYSKEIAPGLVWGQSVSAGSHVKIGRLVALTINSNSTPTLVLPDLAENISYDEARALLTSMGFTLNAPAYTDGTNNLVYSVKYKGRNVGPGTRININEPITLIIGNGNMLQELDPTQTHIDTLNYNEDVLEIM